jgi:hypothetical protein
MRTTTFRTAIRIAAASTTVGLVSMLGAGAASALAINPIGPTNPGGPIGPIHPIKPPVSTTGGLSGTVTTSTCTATPSVYVSDASMGTYAAVTQASPGVWHYSASGLPPGVATVRPTGGMCSLGHWAETSATVGIQAQILSLAPELDFVMPTKVTTVDGDLIAAAADSLLSGLKVHLNDYGPQHANSHQANNSSYVALGAISQAFNIPESANNMKVCGLSVCPSLGHADFYVNDLNLSSMAFAWTASGTLQATASFESAGNEIKGFYTNAAIGENDDMMPDANIDNAQVTMSLVPASDGQGGVTFVAAGTPTFSGTVQATGPCSVLGWDWCDSLTGYKSTISNAFSTAATAAVDSPAVQRLISQQIRPQLTALGVGYVTGVAVDGYNVELGQN